jgi:hypothetical protein
MRRFSRILWIFHAIVSFLEKRFQPGGLYTDIYHIFRYLNPTEIENTFLEWAKPLDFQSVRQVAIDGPI